MLQVISFSILNMYELVDTWLREAWFLNCRTDSQMTVYFPWPNELTICPDINESKSQSKLRVLDTNDVKQKTFLFSVQGKSAWYCFMLFVILFYVICVRYTKYIKCPNIHPSHPLYETIFCQWNMFDFGEYAEIYVTSLWLLWKSYIFPDLYGNSLTW